MLGMQFWFWTKSGTPTYINHFHRSLNSFISQLSHICLMFCYSQFISFTDFSRLAETCDQFKEAKIIKLFSICNRRFRMRSYLCFHSDLVLLNGFAVVVVVVLVMALKWKTLWLASRCEWVRWMLYVYRWKWAFWSDHRFTHIKINCRNFMMILFLHFD